MTPRARAKKYGRTFRGVQAILEEWILAPRATICAAPEDAGSQAYVLRVLMERYHDAVAVKKLCGELNKQWAKETKRGG